MHHPIADRQFIALSKVHKTLFPNHKKYKNKASVPIIIHENASDTELDEPAVANSTLATTSDRT